jgi:O-antigen ligase
VNKVLEWLLIAVIVGSTLAFGGVQPLAYSLMEIALFVGLLALLWHQTREGKIEVRLPVWPILFALLVLLQVLPLPSALIARVSPARFTGPVAAGLATNHSWGTLSIYPHDTWLAWIKMLAYITAFVLAACVFDSRQRQSTLVKALIYLGLFEAAYGITQYLTGWQKIFTYTKQYYIEEATGTFINHNHFAGFLELTLPFVMAYIFYFFQMWMDRRRQRRAALSPAARGSAAGIQALVYVFFLLIFVVAVIFSRSRGGILAMAFTVFAIAILAQFRARRKAWLIGIFLFLLVAVSYGLWIGLDPVLGRFEQMQGPHYFQAEGRLSLWTDSKGLINQYPLTGVGLGDYSVAFTRFQTSMLTYFIDHAHDDYVEFAAETGLVGAALLFLPIIFLLGRMIVCFLKDSRRYRPSILLGCIGSTLAILIHSATDFNLQVTANALVFSVVLGIGYKAAYLEPADEMRQKPAAEVRAGSGIPARRVTVSRPRSGTGAPLRQTQS